MNAVCLLDGLHQRGATVTANGDRLKLAAPPDVLTPNVLAAIKENKSALLQMLPRCEQVLRGQTVVANKYRDRDLIQWPQARGLAVGIMRDTKWGNPFEIGEHGDRDAVCDKHAAQLENSPDLLAQIGELRGKVLVCCCHPKRCHGDELARRANELAASTGASTCGAEIDGADMIAALRAMPKALRAAMTVRQRHDYALKAAQLIADKRERGP